jgi:hypothetical protein
MIIEGAIAVDLVDTDPEAGMELAIKFKLVEKMEHGGNDYIRMTDDGRNVLSGLLKLVAVMANPGNQLKAN